MNLPTLAELNQLPCAQVQLLILRALTTSDLTFNYMLLKPATLKDLITVCSELVEAEEGELTPADLKEFKELANEITQFAEGV